VVTRCENCSRRPQANDSGWPGWCGACIAREKARLTPLANALMWEMYER
jgi:hypothetical protein